MIKVEGLTAAEEAAAEATEATTEEATEISAEDATNETPETLPVTGADTPTMAFVATGVLALAAATVVTRKRG